MSETHSFRIDQADLDQLLAAARLDLTPERRASMFPVFQMVVEMMDSLDALDLTDVIPAAAFDPSWSL